MKIPDKINIAGFTFDIIFYDDREYNQGSNNPASCNTGSQKIFIDKRCHPEQQEVNLLHEIIEAINYNYQLELDHKQITVIAAALYQVHKARNR